METINLFQAKRLQELGFIKDSSRNIEDNDETIYQSGRDYMRDGYRAYDDHNHGESYNAYTVGELISYLPDAVEGYRWNIYREKGQYFVSYGNNGIKSDTLVGALGDTIISLCENGLIK